jgi:hypothetical protein
VKSNLVRKSNLARERAEAQVAEFRRRVRKKGLSLTVRIENDMVKLGWRTNPAKPIESLESGVRYLERLYKLATSRRRQR